MTSVHLHPDQAPDVRATQNAGELGVMVRAQWRTAILRLHFCSIQEAADWGAAYLDALHELNNDMEQQRRKTA